MAKSKFEIPIYDPQTGQLNPHYEELTGKENPLKIKKEKVMNWTPLGDQVLLEVEKESEKIIEKEVIKMTEEEVAKITTKEFEQDNTLYNIFSSLREKVNAPARNRTNKD